MTTTYPLAPRWRRLVALCYETLLLVAVLLAAGMLFQLLWRGEQASVLRRYVEFGYLLSLLFVYFAWCWRRSGQTLAMKTWRLRLQACDGSAPSWRAMLIRFVLALLIYAPLVPIWLWAKHAPGMKWAVWVAGVWAALPAIWSWLDRDGQFFHDRVAGTQIVLVPTVRE
ncbi:RDD family protein [Chitinimonas sp. BJB300]|uniref:RDD family protein n=1 Tax=Chitinimonas sp. BJB300 TaxID=1559339 RepID=UPI000C1215D7|nr:RDD family protein [Chitinimonas sp. BJB300]PHV11437.1 hypothetical protein CSQ89_10985 [Chitinimonas sp. BJB300]TSJ91506.1 RDD family protein [Chitinimonas sp. BJB300]